MQRIKMRPVWVGLHRYVGLAIAVFVAIAGLSGSVLAYIGPLRDWLVPPAYLPTTAGPTLSLDQISARVEAFEARARITQWPLSLHAGKVASVEVVGRAPDANGGAVELAYDTIHLDPVSGRVLGTTLGNEGAPTAARVLDFIYALHYKLALPGEWGSRWGIWIMGIAALLWFIDCFVGAWLTLPRGRPLLAKWKPAWGVKRSRLNFDLHRAGGLWFWGMLAVLALSSVQQNLNQEVFMPVARVVLPIAPDPFAGRAQRSLIAQQSPPKISADAALALALAEAGKRGWQDKPERLQHDSAGGHYRVVFTTPATEWTTTPRRELYVDDTTGALVYVFEPGHGRAGDIVLDWLAALHFGTVFGWPYKLLLCVTGLAIATLSVTGVVVWWRKRRARERVQARPQPSPR